VCQSWYTCSCFMAKNTKRAKWKRSKIRNENEIFLLVSQDRLVWFASNLVCRITHLVELGNRSRRYIGVKTTFTLFLPVYIVTVWCASYLGHMTHYHMSWCYIDIMWCMHVMWVSVVQALQHGHHLDSLTYFLGIRCNVYNTTKNACYTVQLSSSLSINVGLICTYLNISFESSNQLWDIVLIDNQLVMLKQVVVNFKII